MTSVQSAHFKKTQEGSPVQEDPEMDPPPKQAKSATNISRRLKLNEFVQLPPCRGKKKPGEARVLTSAEFLLELDKKEAEKKKQTELKEERKKVRLEKAAARSASKATKTNRTASVKKAVGEAGQPRKQPSNRSKLFFV